MKSPPPKKKTKATSPKVWKVDDRLSLDEATKLIAPKGYPGRSVARNAEDSARHRITGAANTGELRRESDQTFILGYLADWACTTWPGKFDDLPTNVSTAAVDKIEMVEHASMTTLASTFEVCQERYIAAQRRIEDLEKEVAELQTDAKQWRDYYAKVTRKKT